MFLSFQSDKLASIQNNLAASYKNYFSRIQNKFKHMVT